jgi:hypothetical protein
LATAIRSHSKRDKVLDVVSFSPFGADGLFLASPLQSTPVQIPSGDVLRVLDLKSSSISSLDTNSISSSDSQLSLVTSSSKCSGDLEMADYMDAGLVKLPRAMYQEYVKLSEKQSRKQEKIWSAWVSKH